MSFHSFHSRPDSPARPTKIEATLARYLILLKEKPEDTHVVSEFWAHKYSVQNVRNIRCLMLARRHSPCPWSHLSSTIGSLAWSNHSRRQGCSASRSARRPCGPALTPQETAGRPKGRPRPARPARPASRSAPERHRHPDSEGRRSGNSLPPRSAISLGPRPQRPPARVGGRRQAATPSTQDQGAE